MLGWEAFKKKKSELENTHKFSVLSQALTNTSKLKVTNQQITPPPPSSPPQTNPEMNISPQ